jgi:hypothetical protein
MEGFHLKLCVFKNIYLSISVLKRIQQQHVHMEVLA